MNNMKKTLLVLITLLTFLLSTKVQSQNSGRFRLLQERIVQAKMREIKANLQLGPLEFEKFKPIYLMYHREMAEIDLLKLGRLMKVEPDSLSTDEADQLILNQLESAKKIISIREVYYHQFRTVLTPQQIIKLYQTEADMRKKVMDEMKRRRLRD